MDQSLSVRIISPKGLIFEGRAYSVSSKNSSGNFDILPLHANFITFIEDSPITIRKIDNKVINFTFPIAIIHHLSNQVNIYTDIQIAPKI